MRIHVNGESREVEENGSLAELIVSLYLKPEQVAVELNQNVVRRSRWDTTFLEADDKVEIVHFVGGGGNQEAGAGGSRQTEARRL